MKKKEDYYKFKQKPACVDGQRLKKWEKSVIMSKNRMIVEAEKHECGQKKPLL